MWIGDGELRESFTAMIRAYCLESVLSLTGWLSREEALKRLASADLFVHYTRWEGLPNAVLDAMALGLPVVASHVPGNRDAVRPEVTGCLARNETELLEKTLALARDPERGSRMGRAGKDLVGREFSLAGALAKREALYSA